MQPERLSGLEYSIRADVWSTGLSLLELVQNRFPFSSDMPPIELMVYITQSEVRVSFLHRALRFTLLVLHLAAAARRRSRSTLERCHEGLHQRDVRLFDSPLSRAFILTSYLLVCESTRSCVQRQRKCWPMNGSLEL